MRDLVCPAAAAIHPPTDSPSVFCGVLKTNSDGADIHGFTERAAVTPLISGDNDPSVIATYCAGDGIPGSVCSYTDCPIWTAAKQAHWAARRGTNMLRDDRAQRPPTIDPELREAVRMTVGSAQGS